MSRNGRTRRVVWRAALAALLAGGAFVGAMGCGRKIGDGCSTSTDCDPSGGTRTCDLSQPGGYCLIEGCDARSCPEDSFCARFFPEPFLTSPQGLLTTSCDPAQATPACAADEVCVGTGSKAGEAGIPVGVCAKRTWEKRACVQSCGDNGDCRGGYLCRKTGEYGAVALTLQLGQIASYCAPGPRP
ncbi:MAG: hypothetical protein ABUS79_22610 [Pseudomonadota bacterium]